MFEYNVNLATYILCVSQQAQMYAYGNIATDIIYIYINKIKCG